MSSTPPSDHSAGAQLRRAVEVMDRLRSPGGCPWDAEQTHASLAPYLLEEAYETLDAIESNDPIALREELGDLLLQVLFHARLAEESSGVERFDIDDVAADLVAKLIRRHPHVFADVVVDSAATVSTNWDAIKQTEKQRSSVTEGVPMGQPALALTAKLIGRARKAGLTAVRPMAMDDADPESPDWVGEKLFAVVGEAVQAGIDPELALRATARRYAAAVQAEEQSRDRNAEPTD